MVLKERSYPIILLILDTLIRRLVKTNPKLPLLQSDYNKRMAGYWGERRLDELINGIPGLPFLVVRDLCLKVNGVLFQIDTLLLSPYFFLIIESKNISGHLLFDTSYNQLIRINQDNKEEAFEDPILQAQNQKRNLTNWLNEQKLSHPPIETLIAMSNPSAVIRSTSGNDILSKQVIPVKKIPQLIDHLSSNYLKKLLSEKKIEKIAQQLIMHHEPVNVDLFKKYGISKNEILRGVQCSNCSTIPMEYQKGKWLCHKCKTVSKDAHHQAVEDYLLLVKNTITNKEFREFIGIGSVNIASKLLAKMNLRCTGPSKIREYYK